jgi:hypothetical protein
LTDLIPSPAEVPFNATGVVANVAVFFCAEALIFNFAKGLLINLTGVKGGAAANDTAFTFLWTIGLSGTSDSITVSPSGSSGTLKEVCLWAGEGEVSEVERLRWRLLTWFGEAEEGVWDRGRFRTGVSMPG